MDTRALESAVDTEAGRWTVGEVAALAGISVRTLHHYHEIGLVRPSERSPAGYRHYLPEDLDRLRAVLVWRELDFPLDDIRDLVDRPTDARAALLDQRDHLTTHIDRLHRIVRAIDRELEARTMNLQLTPEEKLEVFGDFDPDDHAAEAQERWGDTDAWAQSQRRTSAYTKEDWQQIQADEAELYHAFAALDDAGVDPASTEAMDLAERHRAHISRWYYDCTIEIHEGLGQMYVTDQRFTDTIDDSVDHPGLATYMSEAMTANALRQLDTP